MFKCTGCGECCRNLDKSDIYQELDRGDGTCKYLDGNKCSIYSERPLLCRIDESYETYFRERYSKEEYYELNYSICKQLQNKGG
ncbi:MAG: YkgJ family cysteine cluster protein [Lachnospiraceae bacterium]|nr:YkgJ family cysteine cluster protein [Lachnospiraceae bacterium]